MAKFPYLARRGKSPNWYYKREIPPELRTKGRSSQVWRSLRTADRKAAEKAYAAQHAEIERLFEEWRQADQQPISVSAQPARLQTNVVAPVTPLTPGLLRRLADAHYLNVYDADFQWRGDLWRRARDDEEAFWRGDVIEHPVCDWHRVKGGQQSSYYAYLMEEPDLEAVFLYCVFAARKARLQNLRQQYKLGAGRDLETVTRELLTFRQVDLAESDRYRLLRKLMEVEIKALEDLTAGDESSFDGILDRQETVEPTVQSVAAAMPGEMMSRSMEMYLDHTSGEREWPLKTTLRKRAELREFLEIVGDKPVNGYRQEDGVKFKDTQKALPASRQRAPFKGLSLSDAAHTASELRSKGEKFDLLNPITINDKIGTVSLFFEWAKTRDSSVVNPVAGQAISRPKNKRKGKKRHPWTVEELNRMFVAPIYTGCMSERHWTRRGSVILRRSAKFWVPLIALFSGMRLGEIIQMQVADVKSLEGIDYFDITPIGIDPDDEEAEEADDEGGKSLKTASSRRGIPIHKTLFDLGFREFLEYRRLSNQVRLFPEYEKAKDDGSWSKRFSKYFKRFRDSIGVARRGVKFHSLRHNVEDALRNADVRKEVRDAIQGHGENGVSQDYGSGFYVTTLNEAVQKIRYEGLVLPPSAG